MKILFHDDKCERATIYRGFWRWKESAEVFYSLLDGRWFYLLASANTNIGVEYSLNEKLKETRVAELENIRRRPIEHAQVKAWNKITKLPKAKLVTLKSPKRVDSGW